MADSSPAYQTARKCPPVLLIGCLNPVIRGWVRYHRHFVASRVFNKLDHQIWHKLWCWAKRRHQSKSPWWIRERYWRWANGYQWTFCCETNKGTSSEKPKLLTLAMAHDTEIVRHCKIVAEAHPYEPAWRDYFARRKPRKAIKYRPLCSCLPRWKPAPRYWGFSTT